MAVLAGLALCQGCATEKKADTSTLMHTFVERMERAESTNRTTVSAAPCSGGDAAVSPGDGADWTRTFATMRLPSWRSGDVGASAALSDGRVLWVFGDTTRAAGVKPRMVSNSMLLTRGRCVEEVRPAGNGPVIPARDERTVCWPSSVLAVPMKARDLVLVACSRIERGDGSSGADALYDFSYRGMSLALYSVVKGKAPALVSVENVVPDSPDQEQINWGAAMVGDRDWVYVYGSQQPKGSAGKAAYLARTRLAGVGGSSHWEYWTGEGFSESANDAEPLVSAGEGVSQTFSVVAWRGEYLLVSKQGGEFGRNIGIWKAPQPYGPWRGVKAVPQPYGAAKGIVAYQPLAHPEIPTNDGGLLVSMSRNTEKLADLFDDPRKGRPMFFDISVP